MCVKDKARKKEPAAIDYVCESERYVCREGRLRRKGLQQ
jgi:hypothetical protein